MACFYQFEIITLVPVYQAMTVVYHEPRQWSIMTHDTIVDTEPPQWGIVSHRGEPWWL